MLHHCLKLLISMRDSIQISDISSKPPRSLVAKKSKFNKFIFRPQWKKKKKKKKKQVFPVPWPILLVIPSNRFSLWLNGFFAEEGNKKWTRKHLEISEKPIFIFVYNSLVSLYNTRQLGVKVPAVHNVLMTTIRVCHEYRRNTKNKLHGDWVRHVSSVFNLDLICKLSSHFICVNDQWLLDSEE